MGRLLRVVAATGLVLVGAGCWPMPGANPDRTAHNPFEKQVTAATVGQLTEAWTFTLPTRNAIRNPVVSPAGVHFTAERSCTIVTVDAGTGETRWARGLLPGGQDCFSFPNIQADISDPYVEGNRVSVGAGILVISAPGPPRPPSFSTSAASFDVATGATVGGGGGILEAQRGNVAAGSLGYYDTVGQRIVLSAYVISPAGSRQLAIPDGIVGRATLGTEALYQTGHGLMATEPGDATHGQGVRAYSLTESRPGCGAADALEECPLWATPVDGDLVVRPILGDGGETVYAGTSAGTMYALDAATGAIRWTAPVGSAVTDSPALANGSLYVPTGSGDLVVLDATTGAPRWTAATGSPMGVQPAVASDVVVTGSDDGSLRAFPANGCGAATCPPLWSATTGRRITGAPVISLGHVYAGTDDGRLVAYGLP